MILGGGKHRVAKLNEEIEMLRDDNKRLRAALNFYANPKNWSDGVIETNANDGTIFANAEMDKGAIALKVLAR
ncbi:MAG: hypothetical protein E2O36_07860 [Proteobacteria bacterium]|nr:MAG: hypothetical protein E2O36_07860 [Pseudomonadota bacterium]